MQIFTSALFEQNRPEARSQTSDESRGDGRDVGIDLDLGVVTPTLEVAEDVDRVEDDREAPRGLLEEEGGDQEGERLVNPGFSDSDEETLFVLILRLGGRVGRGALQGRGRVQILRLGQGQRVRNTTTIMCQSSC